MDYFQDRESLALFRVTSCIQAYSLIKEFLTPLVHLSNLGKNHHLRSLIPGVKVVVRQKYAQTYISARDTTLLDLLS